MKYKPFLYLLTFTVLSFLACRRDSYVAAFEQLPQERAAEQIALVKEKLTQAPNGWIAVTPTGLGGGFGFYMKFDENGFVNMYADMNDSTATKVRQSQYRVRQDMGTALTFDTYNYITLLNDPTPGVFGGNIREGFRSDIDFIYDHSTADSIVFIGKRYRQIFSLVKATPEQETLYNAGSYKNFINQIKSFFTANPNAYFDYDNIKIAIEPNLGNSLAAGKRISLSALYGDSIASATAKYAFTVDQMSILNGGVNFSNTFFNRISWKDANTLAVKDVAGKEYIVKNNATPLLPLYKLWGSKYTGMLSNFKTIYPGTSAAGADLLNTFHNRLASRPPLSFAFNFGRLNFVWDVINKRLRLDAFHSQNGGTSGWTTSATFKYTVDANGVYSFNTFSGFSGGYVEAILPPLRDFLLSNEVKFDYFVNNGTLYAQMSSVTNPSIIMTFALTI